MKRYYVFIMGRPYSGLFRGEVSGKTARAAFNAAKRKYPQEHSSRLRLELA